MTAARAPAASGASPDDGWIFGGGRGAAAAARTALAPLSWAFGGIARARRALYRRRLLPAARLGVPVIAVGNLTVGGTGKTPLVLWLAARLQERGARPAILTRGYGARVGGAPRVVRPPAAGESDEALLLATRLPGVPVVAGKDRAGGGRLALRAGARCLILDDGFQHLRLHRDLDVLLLDPRVPPPGGRLLPSGPLREPWSAASDADVLMVVDGPDTPSPNGRPLVRARRHASRLRRGAREMSAGGELNGRRVFLLSAIARPARFRALVEEMGGVVAGEARHPDHHRFTPDEIAAADAAARAADAEWILTTEKDAARLPAPFLARDRTAVLQIDLAFDEGESDLLDAVSRVLR